MKIIKNKLIKSLCQISGLVYNNPNFFYLNYKTRPFTKELKSLYICNKTPLFIESNLDCQCYITIINNDTILCAFRGTDDTKDWLSNVNVQLIDMKLEGIINYPLVHCGMLKQFNSVKNKITDYIENELNNNTIKNIIYTGHSLGGSLATIAGQYYGHKYSNLNHGCITFGAPRCGNYKFREKI